MRSTKFRGRVKGEEWFVFGEPIHNFCFEPDGKRIDCVICFDNDYTEVEPESICQFTGRKIKNTDLYENDKVLSLDGEEMTVVWDEEHFCWYFKTDNDLFELYIDIDEDAGILGQ